MSKPVSLSYRDVTVDFPNLDRVEKFPPLSRAEPTVENDRTGFGVAAATGDRAERLDLARPGTSFPSGADDSLEDHEGMAHQALVSESSFPDGVACGISEGILAQHVARFAWMKGRPEDRDEDEASADSVESDVTCATQSTTNLSCVRTPHGESRMAERCITVELVQRAKKYGAVSLELQCTGASAPRRLKRARAWADALARCKGFDVEVLFCLVRTESRPPRVEVGLAHREKAAPEIKRWLIARGYFVESGNRIAFADPRTSTRVIERRDEKDRQIKVVTVFFRRRGKLEKVGDEQPKGRRFLCELAGLERSTDTFCIKKELVGMLAQGRRMQDIRTQSTAGIVLRANGTITITGIDSARASAWAKIKRLMINVEIPALRKDGLALQFVDDEVRCDKEAVMVAVLANGLALQYAADEIRSDIDICSAALKQNPLSFQFFHKDIRGDKDTVMAAVKLNGLLLKYAVETLQDDPEVVAAAVRQNPDALQFASPNLKCGSQSLFSSKASRTRKSKVLAAVQKEGLALHDASDALKDDEAVVLAAVLQNRKSIRYASQRIRSDCRILSAKSDVLAACRDFFLEAIVFNPQALEHASEALRSDREFVLDAMRNNGLALQYVPSIFKLDIEVVEVALSQNSQAPFELRFASSKGEGCSQVRSHLSKQTKEEEWEINKFVLHAVETNGLLLQYGTKEVRASREVVLAALYNNGDAILFAADELKCCPKLLPLASKTILDDEQFMSEVVQRNGLALEFASHKIRSNQHIVILAIKQNSLAFMYASPELQQNKPFIVMALQFNAMLLEHVAEELECCQEAVLAAVRNNGTFVTQELALCTETLSPGSLQFLANKDYMLNIVQKNGIALMYVSTELKDDFELVLTAVLQNRKSIRYASERIKSNSSTLAAESDVLAACRDFFLEAIVFDPAAMVHASEVLRSDRDLVLEAMRRNGLGLQYVHHSFKLDIEVAKLALSQNLDALKYVATEVQDDDDILAIVKDNAQALQYVTNRAFVLSAVQANWQNIMVCASLFRADKQIATAAIQQNAFAIHYVPACLTGVCHTLPSSDPVDYSHEAQINVAVESVIQCGLAIQFFSEEIKSHALIMEIAVAQNGLALQFASPALQGEEGIVHTAVRQNGLALQFASEAFRGDVRTVLAAVTQNGMALQYASYLLKESKEIVIAAVRQNWNALRHASKLLQVDSDILLEAPLTLLNDEVFVLRAVSFNDYAMHLASEQLKKNKEFVLKALAANGLAFRHCNKEFQGDEECFKSALATITLADDTDEHEHDERGGNEKLGHTHTGLSSMSVLKDIASMATQCNGMLLQHCPENLRNDVECVKAAVQNNGLALEFASASMKGNKSIVAAALMENHKAIIYVPPEVMSELKSDKLIMLDLVRQDWTYIKLCANFLLEDNDIVLSALSSSPEAMCCVSPNFFSREDALASVPESVYGNLRVVFAAVQGNGLALKYASDDLKANPELVKQAVLQNGLALEFASAAIRARHDIVVCAFNQNKVSLRFAATKLQMELVYHFKGGTELQYASAGVRGNLHFVKSIVTRRGLSLQFASSVLQNHAELVACAVDQDGLALQFASEGLKKEIALVKVAVRQNGLALQFASEDLTGVHQVVKAAVMQCGLALQHAARDLQGNKELVLLAVKQNGLALEFASAALRQDSDVVHCAALQNVLALQYAFHEDQNLAFPHLMQEHPEPLLQPVSDEQKSISSECQSLSSVISSCISSFTENVEPNDVKLSCPLEMDSKSEVNEIESMMNKCITGLQERAIPNSNEHLNMSALLNGVNELEASLDDLQVSINEDH